MKKVISMNKGEQNKKEGVLDAKAKKLHTLACELEEFKMRFAELVDEYEEDGADESTMDVLGEALAAVDDAIDDMNDILA